MAFAIPSQMKMVHLWSGHPVLPQSPVTRQTFPIWLDTANAMLSTYRTSGFFAVRTHCEIDSHVPYVLLWTNV